MRRNWQLDLDVTAFLAEHWQRKPLLIRNTSAGFTPPICSDRLAGLALEHEVESRLIEQRGDNLRVQHGPFCESDFTRAHPWTLLVQAVDHYCPEVGELQRLFDFIPRWRMDDVMVSYAVDGGSVGPHYDNYDVFLLQGEGQRLWRLGQHCDHHTPLLPGHELRILRDFHTIDEYLLGPGDILYVPPGVAHWGIAQGECTTFSIGFRAPQISDMLSRWSDQLLLQMTTEQFYSDTDRAAATRPGEIHADDIRLALAQLQRALRHSAGNQWFGELVTEPRYDIEPDEEDIAEALDLLRGGASVVSLSHAAKLAWQQHNGGFIVFANGESRHCGASVLPCLLILCDRRDLAGRELDSALSDSDTVVLLESLLQSGCLYVE